MTPPVDPDIQAARIARRIRNTGLSCLALAVAMVGAAYAAVPLYDLFCRVTGFDGTPIASTRLPSGEIARTVRIRFDTNVAPGLGWTFQPETAGIETVLGRTETVFFRVRNDGPRAATGVSTYNVQPGQAGAVFVKLKCFCFEEQTLKPGETMDFPVVFYVDPSLADDPTLSELNTITLSYTYFASRNGQPVASVGPSKPRT